MNFTGNPNDLRAIQQFYGTDANSARMIQQSLLQQAAQVGSGGPDYSYHIGPDGMANSASYSQTGNDETGDRSRTQVGYLRQNPAGRVGDWNQTLDMNGNVTENWHTQKDDTLQGLLKGALFVGGVGLGGAALAGAMGGGAAAGGAGGFLGEGALSGIGAWDGALAGASPWSAGAAGAGEFGNTLLSSSEFGAPGGSVGGAGGFIGEGAASGIPAWDGALSGAAAAGGGSSLLNALGGVKGLLGPAATLLGAAAGSQSQGGGETTKKMDPRMDPYVYGEGGLLPRAMGLLQQDMSPERRAQWDQMRAAGMGLLSQPPAGNAFDRFYGGKR